VVTNKKTLRIPNIIGIERSKYALATLIVWSRELAGM
jgi:hypothetical protein